MSVSLLEDIAPTGSEFKELADFPLSVVAMITIQFGRIERDFDMKAWAWDSQLVSPRVGNVKYHIAYNAQGYEPFMQVTRENEQTKAQKTWRIDIADLHQFGARAKVREL